MANIRSGLRLIAVSAAVVLGLGSVSASGGTNTDTDETLRLHLSDSGTYFEYSNRGAPMTQQIGASHKCKITVDGPLALLSGSGNGPGMFQKSIGVKSGGAQGAPCGQVASPEELTLSLGPDMPVAVQAALDLELTGSHRGTAMVDVVLSLGEATVGTYQVRTGKAIVEGEGNDGSRTKPFTATATSAEPIANCFSGTSHNGSKDNCYVTIIPSGPFDTITFTPLTGQMSLEGGGDYGQGTAFDTVFTLQGFDGELGCEDDNNTADIEQGTVFGQITRLQNTDGSPCVAKPYNLSADVEEDTLTFVPHDNIGAPQQAAYQATLMFAPELATIPFTSQLEYDQDDDGAAFDFENMPWCTVDPFLTPDEPGSIDTSVIPAGHTWCVAGSSTQLVGVDQIRTTWNVVGIGDPKFR